MRSCRIPLHFAFFLVLLTPYACNDGNGIETVERRDDQGQTERFQRRKKDAAKHGLYQKYTTDGKLLEEARYVNDTIDGEHKTYYTNGKTESVEHYSHGQYHGKYLKYYDSGNLDLEQTFVNGAMQGTSIKYYPNGAVKEKVTLKDNEENGPFTEYNENGILKAEGNYLPGEDGGPLEEGELKEYDDNGQLIRIADCKKGVCLTKWKKN
jgi:antitoxin component YwqK of YwqJK toxin-antitoxin module